MTDREVLEKWLKGLDAIVITHDMEGVKEKRDAIRNVLARAERDYKDMRRFQRQYIRADHERIYLKAENERLRSDKRTSIEINAKVTTRCQELEAENERLRRLEEVGYIDSSGESVKWEEVGDE